MGNVIELPNITLDFLEETKENSAKSKSTFLETNYLDTRLAEGETNKTIVFRLLPMDLTTGNPFVIIHTHNVQVPKEMVKKGQQPFKSYICLKHTDGIDNEKFGKACPFCEINKQAYDDAQAETDPVKKKTLIKYSCSNKSRPSVICRGIQRGKENEGVKFYKFNIRDDKADPYNTIKHLAKIRKDAAIAQGKTENILDLYEGRDLIFNFSDDPKSAPTIFDASEKSPLTTDKEQLERWINDEKKWQDVFTCKPYDYLKLVAEGCYPFFDKKENKWIDKIEFDKKYKNFVSAETSDIEKSEENLSKMSQAVEEKVKQENKPVSIISELSIDDDDMPF